MTKDVDDVVRRALPSRPELLGGTSGNFGFVVTGVNLVGGERVTLQAAGVTVLVGANNAGKSTLLAEVASEFRSGPPGPGAPRLAVDSLDFKREGELADFVAWIASNAHLHEYSGHMSFSLAPMHNVNVRELESIWLSLAAGDVRELAAALCFHGDAQGRFGVSTAAEMRESIDDPAMHSVHRLENSTELLAELSAISQTIFGQSLTLDRVGRTRRLRVGDVGLPAPAIDDISREYRDRMTSLPPLESQGDGMRSLIGQLLPLVTASHRLLLIDEPEAFLHPPQAHGLGVQLGKLAATKKVQVVVATHDRSLLTGLLDSGADVSVVRLSRQDGTLNARSLSAERLKEIWRDPVLRYTNVLDGLFHRLVVVTEGDADCGYLAAALDWSGRPADSIPRGEILFVPTGGKGGLAKVCAALRAVGVPLVAAPDLDMLADKRQLAELVGAVGGTWTSDMDKSWRDATSQFTNGQAPAKVGHILSAIQSALGGDLDAPYTPELRETVKAHLRTSRSPWEQVKEFGTLAFKGESRAALDRLLALLDQEGVVLLRVGELERLAPEVTVRKGPGWLSAALGAGTQGNAATQDHLDRIIGSAFGRAGR